MGFLNTLISAATERRGFEDGIAGKPRAFEFCESFPQDTQIAKAYNKGYKNGQEAAKIRLMNKAGNTLDKIP